MKSGRTRQNAVIFRRPLRAGSEPPSLFPWSRSPGWLMMTMSLHSAQGSPLGAKASVWSAVSHSQLQTEPALEIAPAASVQDGRLLSPKLPALRRVRVHPRYTHQASSYLCWGQFQHRLGLRGESGVLSRPKPLTRTPDFNF